MSGKGVAKAEENMKRLRRLCETEKEELHRGKMVLSVGLSSFTGAVWMMWLIVWWNQ